MVRRVIGRDDLVDVVRAGLGRGLVGVERLTGGTSKGVYRLRLDDGSTAVAYRWDAAENYWSDDAGGAELFESAYTRFEAAGVRTPRVHVLDRSRDLHPADYALVEDVTGERLSEVAELGPRTLEQLGDALRAMAEQTGPPPERPCEETVLERALVDLGESAERVERVGAVRKRFDGLVRDLAATVEPRSRHGLVHGELGPEHVLVGAGGEPVVIDIEGASFTDVEWEHAFIGFRFGERYRWLEVAGLDGRRVRFYRLARHLALVAGPLRLLDGDFPHRDGMVGIVDANIEHALGYLR